MNGRDALAARLAELWDRFRDTNIERVEALGRAADSATAGTLTPDARLEAQREAHKLAGTLGSFGLHHATDRAREAEGLLYGDEPLDPDASETLAAIARDLESAIRRGPGGDASG